MRSKLQVYILIIFWGAVLLSLTGCKYCSGNQEETVKLDSVRVSLQDSLRQYERVKKVDFQKSILRGWLNDGTLLKPDTAKKLFQELDATEIYYGKVVAEKNATLFAANRQIKQCQCKEPNVWLLIGIVVLMGLLGGLAGPRFGLLTEISGEGSEAVKAAEKVVADSEALINQVKSNVANNPAMAVNEHVSKAMSEATTSLEKVKKETAELKKLHEKNLAYLIFGLVAATLSFVALSIFDSKVLEFNTTIDYFIFAGYSLLGAVFAKKWIEQLYEVISKQRK